MAWNHCVIVLAWVFALAGGALAQRQIYFVDGVVNKIQRVEMHSSGSVTDLVTGLDFPIDIDVDIAGGKMYWNNANAFKIQRANLDGTSVQDLVTTGVTALRGIALDLTNNKMYWTDAVSDKVQRANLDGSSVEDLVTGLNDPQRIALDVPNNKMYWASAAATIQRANLDGTGLTNLITGLNNPFGMDLDLTNNKLYWSDRGTDKIQRSNLDGSSIQDVVTGVDVVFPIKVDEATGKIYWLEDTNNKLQRADVGGTNQNVEDILTTGLSSPRGLFLDTRIGESTVARGIPSAATANPGSEVELYRIGITGDGTNSISNFNIKLNNNGGGLTTSDFNSTALKLYRSTDNSLNTSSDTQIGTLASSSLNVDGTISTISPSAAETPANGAERFYFITATLASTRTDEAGTASKNDIVVSANAGQVNLSNSTTTGEAIATGNDYTIDVTATKLVFSTQPAGAVHGQALTTQPVVQAQDSNGNVAASSSAAVTLSGGGGATVEGSTSTTAVNGVATFSGVKVSGGGSGRTLTAAASGLSSATSSAFAVGKATATVTVPSASFAYDGGGKSLSAVTTPADLAVTFTYSSGSAPIGPGTFSTTATVNDANYQGSGTGTIVIDRPPPPAAILNASLLRGHAPLTVRFSEASTGYSNNHLLEFFDGRLASYRHLRREVESPSLLAPVDFTYERPGTYDLLLTVKGPGGTGDTLVTIVAEAKPVVSGLSSQVRFLENTVNEVPALLDSAVTLTDADSPAMEGGRLVVSYASGGGVEDQLAIRHLGDGPGQIGVAAGAVRYGGVPIGTLPLAGEGSGVDGQSLRVALNSNATLAAVEALIKRVSYQNILDQPTLSRTLSVVVEDNGEDGASAPALIEVVVTAQADEAARFFIDTAVGGGLSRQDGGAAQQTRLNLPFGVATGSSGQVYVAETGSHRIRRVGADVTISTVAGTGKRGSAGDGGPAVRAQLAEPRGVFVAPSGELYIADTNNHRIRKVAGDGTISTVAGTGESGFSDDGRPATQAHLRTPWGVSVAAAGEVFIADTGNHRIRKVAADGRISTVAGTGQAGFAGDEGPAANAKLNSPSAVAIAPSGELYIADTNNHRIRKVAVDGRISTVAGTGQAGFAGDGGPATGAQLAVPRGVAVGEGGVLFIADTFNRRIRRVEVDGTISTVAGNTQAGFAGDRGLAEKARLNYPFAVAVADQGQVYVADTMNHRIRRLEERLVPLKELARLLAQPEPRAKIAGEQHLWHGIGLDPGGNLVRGLFGEDSRVEDDDLILFSRQFGHVEGDPDFDSVFDLNGDGAVNLEDFFLMSDDFGREAVDLEEHR